jgi:hypothetical protein
MTPEEIEELYARRLSDKVTASVDAAMKRRYAWIGAIAVVASWVGGVAVVRSMVQSSVDEQVKGAVAAHIADYEQMRTSIVNADVTTSAGLVRLKSDLDELDKRRQDLADLLTKTQAFADKVQQDLGQASKKEADLEQNIAQSNLTISQNNQRVQEQIERLGKATDNIVGLATQLKQLQDSVAVLAKGSKVTVAATDTTAVQNIITSVKQSTSYLSGATVYLEYAGGPNARATALKIADQLKSPSINVPGVENVSARVNEVRFYYDEDAPLAGQVADSATKAKAGLGLGGPPVQPKSYTTWPRAKPPKNTIELWIDLSQVP